MNDVNGANGEPTGGQAGGQEPNGTDAGASRFRPRKILVKGQEFVIDSPDKELEFLQKGAAFDRNVSALNEEKRRIREERARELQSLEPLLEIDRRLREDPIKARKVAAIINDQPLPPDIDDGDTDDPYMQRIAKIERNQERIMQRFEGSVGAVREELGGFKRDQEMHREEKYLRKKYDWATDDDLEAAREFASAKGIDLVTAFKATAFDEMPERVRRTTLRDFDIDERALTPARSEDLVIDGLGPTTDPRVQARLYDDPDLYHRFKPAIRAARRARTGRQELVR